MHLALVVVAFDRIISFSRILNSLCNSEFLQKTKLYLSIDGGGAAEIIKIANNFRWPHGDMEIKCHTENLGLRKHILACGDLVINHDAIIILEDDMFVSPSFSEFAAQTLQFYRSDEKIAGISLYAHSFNETAEMPFLPLNDGNDVFFMQLASSWGQCFSRDQWKKFRSWYDLNKRLSRDQLQMLPTNVANWPESSWKKYFISYMIENDLYFVYPRNAYCTNFADKGVNQKNDDHFQVPLNFGKDNMCFCKFSESRVIYDSYCEILPSSLNSFVNKFLEYDYTVDLYGNKPISQLKTAYILTSRSSSTNPIHSYARKMIPHEANVIAGIAGDDITFSHIRDINTNTQGYSNKRVVYFHRLPIWHLKEKMAGKSKQASLTEKEEALLRIYSKKAGKALITPLLWLHNLYKKIKKCFNL